MPDFTFQVEDAQATLYAAAPLLSFRLRVTNAATDEPIHTVVLRCQVQIEATRRRYAVADRERLFELFGEPERWSQTLKSMLWTIVSVTVPPFCAETVVDLYVPCTYDFNVAAAKYFYALEDGEVPLTLMFSGTAFYEAENGALQIAQIPWDKEAIYRLPVHVWKEMMDHYYPNGTFLSLHKDVFDRLYRYKMQHGLPTWEQVLERLLPPENGKAEP